MSRLGAPSLASSPTNWTMSVVVLDMEVETTKG